MTKYPRLTVATTILGSSLAFIDGSVVNVALPALARDLHAGPAALPWTINAYLLPLGALILLGGGAGDHFGRRRLFLMGLALFVLASIGCALAPSLAWLLAARGVQGVGAAMLMPNSLAILGAAFEGDERGKAIGTWAAAGALAGALGPLLGGWLVDTVGWRIIFLINVPVGLAAGYLAWRYVEETREHRKSALDWRGAALASASLGLMVWALTAWSASMHVSAAAAVAALLGVALMTGFIAWELHLGDRALMPPAMFATRTFVGLTLLTFFLYASLGGLLVLLPYLLIQVEHWSALQAGAALLPVPLVIGFGSRLMGRLTAKYGGRVPLTIGSAIVGLGFALYAFVGRGSFSYWADILPATLLVAAGMGISVAPLTTTVMASVEADHVGAASGFNSAIARIAGLMATALLGFVFAQSSGDGFLLAFRIAVLTGAVASAIAAGCAWLLVSSASSQKR
jgi:EmrB/QacA subfamily drug resistance transporter